MFNAVMHNEVAPGWRIESQGSLFNCPKDDPACVE